MFQRCIDADPSRRVEAEALLNKVYSQGGHLAVLKRLYIQLESNYLLLHCLYIVRDGNMRLARQQVVKNSSK